MTTIEIELSDELAARAQAAGLLNNEGIETLLSEQLRRQAGEALRAMWAQAPLEELTPEIEEMIKEQVREVRAERRTAEAKAQASKPS